MKDLSKINIRGIPVNLIPAGNGNTLYDVAEILLNEVFARDLNNYIQVKDIKVISFEYRYISIPKECDGSDNPYCDGLVITGTPDDLVFQGMIP